MGVDSLPANLYDAVNEFKADPLMIEAMGPHITEKIVEAKTQEWNEYRKYVSKWEIDRYIYRY